MDRHVLFLSTSAWDLPCRFRRHHFASHLAHRGWRVLYVEPITTVTSLFRTRGLSALRPSAFRGRLGQPEDCPSLAVYRPPAMLPFHVKSPFMGRLNRRLLRGALHRQAREHFGSDSYVQVANHPQDRHLLRADRPVVYDVMDRFSAYPEYQRSRLSIEAEARSLADRADRVTATTAALADVVEADRRRVIPNGVDLEHHRGLRDAPAPADLEALPPPRIVYVGALYQWFDFELVADLARRHPDMSFVLIGFSDRPLPRLTDNVAFLGPKAGTELPRYLWNCDLGIIPFVDGPLTRDVDPLKFYEYLACDLPVVSSPMHSLEQWVAPGVLTLARDATSFSAAILTSLREAADLAAEARRRAIAEEHDWQGLSRRFEEVLQEIREAR